MRLQRESGNEATGRVWDRGAGAGPAGTTAAGPMLEAKLMNLIN